MKSLLAFVLLLPILAWGQDQTDTSAELRKLAWQQGLHSAHRRTQL